MFEKLFGSKEPQKQTVQERNPAEDAMARAIANAKQQDPLIGVKLGSKAFLDTLINALKNERGIHADSLLGIIGSLGGFSCQMSVRALNSNPGFITVDGNDGRRYFFGDQINIPLAQSPHSFYNVAGGGAQMAGATSFPDLEEMFGYVAGVVGCPEFGIPRIPENHRPGDLPVNYVRDIWPKMPGILAQHCDTPEQWPLFFGLTAQHAIIFVKNAIDPALALKLVMECAIPMSKINPEEYLSR